MVYFLTEQQILWQPIQMTTKTGGPLVPLMKLLLVGTAKFPQNGKANRIGPICLSLKEVAECVSHRV
jgi:hypothetical protein